MPGNENCLLPVSGVADAARRLRAGTLTAHELAEAVISAADAHRDLRAYISLNADQLRAAARASDARLKRGEPCGALHGVPLILKDNIDTRTLPTTGGTPALKGNQPSVDAPVAERLFASGALLAGKANLHELAAGGTSANHAFGAVANPFDFNCVPGGSSGGTAAAIAAGLVPGGLGTDTAGSVRVPASLCGIVGFRPSKGRYPADGIVPLSRTLDTAGPMARSVTDVGLLDTVLAGDPGQAQLGEAASARLGVPRDSLLAGASPAVQRVVEQALQQIQAAGVELVTVDLAETIALTGEASGVLIGAEFVDVMKEYLAKSAPSVSLADLLRQVASPDASKLLNGPFQKPADLDVLREVQEDRLPRLREHYLRLYNEAGIDALIYPTTPDVALPRAGDDSVIRDGQPHFSWFYFSNTVLASVAGNPSLSIPAGLTEEGMPVGLSIDGLPGTDRRTIAIGRLLEQQLPDIWGQRYVGSENK